MVCNQALPLDRHKYCSLKCKLEAEKLAPSIGLENLKIQVEATTAWRPCDLDKVMHIVTPRLLVLSDIHCPVHDPKWLALAIACGKALGCRDVLVNGDFIDATTISKHLGSYWRRGGELNDDVNAADAVLGVLELHFERIFFDIGNHDQRLMRQFGGEISFQRIMKMFGAHPKLITTERSWCMVNNTVKVVHPRQYSKKRGNIAQNLSQHRQCSILTGHQHHSAMTISPDGNFQACDVGCLADLELQDYVRNELTDYADPVNGFAVIFGNKIQCFDKFTPWELWKLEDEAARYLPV